MFAKFKNWWREFRLSLRMKIILSILAIAVVLLMSSVISVLEYRHMTNYVSGMMAEDINDLRNSQRLGPVRQSEGVCAERRRPRGRFRALCVFGLYAGLHGAG